MQGAGHLKKEWLRKKSMRATKTKFTSQTFCRREKKRRGVGPVHSKFRHKSRKRAEGTLKATEHAWPM